jgi:hypothetical protein
LLVVVQAVAEPLEEPRYMAAVQVAAVVQMDLQEPAILVVEVEVQVLPLDPRLG